MSQGSILGLLLFLNYINDWYIWWSLILVTLFGDDTSLLSVVQNKNDSASQSLTTILMKLVIGLIHEKCILTKIPQNNHKKWSFQGTIIGLCIDEKRNYKTHLKENISKAYESIGSSESSPKNFQDKLLLQYMRHL